MAGGVSFLVASGSVVAAALDQDEGRVRRPIPIASPTTSERSRAPVHRRLVLGRSVRGRPIDAFLLGARARRASILVVGCIHGNEPAGIAVAQDLVTDPAPKHLALAVVPDLNPDGVAAGTRQNADLVDLNRNFPFHWRPIGPPGDLHYAGPHALSEPESRIAVREILRLRPHVTIWFHQHENVVDLSGGQAGIERRYATLTGMRVARLTRYPGSAAGWQNHALPGTTAFVVELPGGSLAPRGVERFSDAILGLLRPGASG